MTQAVIANGSHMNEFKIIPLHCYTSWGKMSNRQFKFAADNAVECHKWMLSLEMAGCAFCWPRKEDIINSFKRPLLNLRDFPNPMGLIPDLMYEIALRLDLQSLSRLGRVNKFLYCLTNSLWPTVARQLFAQRRIELPITIEEIQSMPPNEYVDLWKGYCFYVSHLASWPASPECARFFVFFPPSRQMKAFFVLFLFCNFRWLPGNTTCQQHCRHSLPVW